MNTALYFLVAFLACTRAANTTYTLTESSNGWTVDGQSGSNPTLTTSVGDVLTFNITSLIGFTFQISNGNVSYLSTPSELNTSGVLTVTIESDVAGSNLTYGDATNQTLQGTIVVNSVDDNQTQPEPTPAPGSDGNNCPSGTWSNNGVCQTCGSCGAGQWITYPCTQWNDVNCAACTPCEPDQETIEACNGTQTTDSTVCGASNSSNCPLSDSNCLSSQCWNENGALVIQCTQCADGYWIGSDWTCHACQSCNVGEYISYPCGGWTPTICSPCTPCNVIYPDGVTVTACNGTGNADAAVCAHAFGGIDNCVDGTGAVSTKRQADNSTDNGNSTSGNGNSTSDDGNSTSGNGTSGDNSTSGNGNGSPDNSTSGNNTGGSTGTVCSQCASGYFIDNGACTACPACPEGQSISTACSGSSTSSDQVCANYTIPAGCDTFVYPNCTSCFPGFTLEADGTCTSSNCVIYGCGAATNATCTEFNATAFLCYCPGSNDANLVTVPGVFNGTCDVLTPQQIVANIDFAQLEAFLVNGVFEITGLIEIDIDGATFNVDINTTTTIDNFENVLAEQIAKFLGGGYTASDITVTVTPATSSSSKRDANVPITHTASITISADANSATSAAISFSLIVALAAFFAL